MSVALVARVFDTQANQRFEVTFERFPVRIGRNQLNDLHIDRPYVSQFHAALDVRDGHVFIRDLGSTNGTVHKAARLQRDTPIDITQAPEFSMGPIVVQVAIKEADAQKGPQSVGASVLDDPGALRGQRVQVGAEDPFVRQIAPYVEAYRAAWAAVYRVIYDHLGRVPADARNNYLRRLGSEYPGVAAEADFQKLAQYYGVDGRLFADISPAHAAHAALVELAKVLAPGTKVDDATASLAFARRLRDTLDVFLKCFVSLRDGYQEFQAEMLAREKQQSSAPTVATAKDAKELGLVLLGPNPMGEPSRELQGIFVDVMAHQVALLNGVMEGVKSLLDKLSPKSIEDDFERKGKKGGLFSSRFEELWKAYETRHGDYSGQDKDTFLIIFGPQFSRAYAAAAGEEAKASGEGAKNNMGRFTIQHPGPLPTTKR